MKERFKFNVKVEWFLLKKRIIRWWFLNVKYR